MPRAELDELTQLGTNAFTTHARDELCEEYPLFITSGGLWERGYVRGLFCRRRCCLGLVPAEPAWRLPPQQLPFCLWHSWFLEPILSGIHMGL